MVNDKQVNGNGLNGHLNGHSKWANEDPDDVVLFTSESVGEGHPDKICDQISDAILDAHLKLDSSAKVACETIAKTGLVMVFGKF